MNRSEIFDLDPEDFIHPLCADAVILRRARYVLIERCERDRRVVADMERGGSDQESVLRGLVILRGSVNDMTAAEEAIGKVLSSFPFITMFDNDDDDEAAQS